MCRPPRPCPANVQELTETWQQSIAENAWLNRENIQLRSSLQQLNALVTGGSNSGSVPGAAPKADKA